MGTFLWLCQIQKYTLIYGFILLKPADHFWMASQESKTFDWLWLFVDFQKYFVCVLWGKVFPR